MAQNREKSALRKLIDERGLKDLNGVQELVKELTSGLIQEIMDAEPETELGYSKYDYKNKQTDNARNGYYKKSVQSSQGDVQLQIPGDRIAEYEPQIVKKHQMDISEIEDKIIFLYSQGTSTRDIEKTMQEMYGIEVDASRVSKITDKLLPIINEWQNRALESVYAMLMLDAIHYKVREDGIVVKKSVYIAIGTDLEGKKDVLGIWIGATESSKYWLNVLTGLKNRGVADILIASVDGLSGFCEAIAAAFPKTEVQRCIIHQIRSTTKYVSYKDIKAFTSELKPICAIRSWREHWDELATMFKYPEQIRRIIYTTNAIENFNRQLRKVTKTKSAFVSDDALIKQLYLVTIQITDKWTMPIRDWGSILMQLMIYFGERLNIRL